MSDDTTRLPSSGKTTHVPVRTPSGGLWDCPVGYLSIALERGYARLDGDESVPLGKPDTSGFDPAEHGVREINDYLASVIESPGEIDRVLAAEAAGTARTTIVDPRPPVG